MNGKLLKVRKNNRAFYLLKGLLEKRFLLQRISIRSRIFASFFNVYEVIALQRLRVQL